MAKNEKSKAELYREERKERIAKANKKNAKSIEAGKTVGNIIKKVVAVVLVAAIVCGIGYYALKTSGAIERYATAVKFADGTKVSASDYNYYYSSIYSASVSMAQYYSQYGYNYDTNTPPDEQYTTDENGEQITYAEYFKKAAVDRAQYIEAYYAEAMKDDSFKLSDDVKAEIDETIQNYADSASESGYTLSAYLKANFGAGINEKKFRKLIEKQQTVEEYTTYIKEKYSEDVSDDEVNAEYKENRKLYDYVDIRYYKVSADVLTADEGESDDDLAKRQEAANKDAYAQADAILAKATSVDAFEAALKEYVDAKEEAEKAEAEDKEETKEETAGTEEAAEAEEEEEKTYAQVSKHSTYESFKSAAGEEAADWAFSADRKAGNAKVFKDDTNAYIVYIEKPIYTGHSVDVRHLLVQFNAEDSSNVTDEEKKAALEKAEGYLAEFKNGEQTDDDFAALANQYSEDTGSNESGGLYAGMRITDSYVEPFLNWSFDPARKAGDVEIIESTYGYHIMYFKADNKDDYDWAATIRSNLGSSAYEEFDNSLVGDDGAYKPEVSEYWTNYISEKFCSKIKRNIALSA